LILNNFEISLDLYYSIKHHRGEYFLLCHSKIRKQHYGCKFIFWNCWSILQKKLVELEINSKRISMRNWFRIETNVFWAPICVWKLLSPRLLDQNTRPLNLELVVISSIFNIINYCKCIKIMHCGWNGTSKNGTSSTTCSTKLYTYIYDLIQQIMNFQPIGLKFYFLICDLHLSCIYSHNAPYVLQYTKILKISPKGHH